MDAAIVGIDVASRFHGHPTSEFDDQLPWVYAVAWRLGTWPETTLTDEVPGHLIDSADQVSMALHVNNR